VIYTGQIAGMAGQATYRMNQACYSKTTLVSNQLCIYLLSPNGLGVSSMSLSADQNGEQNRSINILRGLMGKAGLSHGDASEVMLAIKAGKIPHVYMHDPDLDLSQGEIDALESEVMHVLYSYKGTQYESFGKCCDIRHLTRLANHLIELARQKMQTLRGF
jgi:hypothetical protein